MRKDGVSERSMVCRSLCAWSQLRGRVTWLLCVYMSLRVRGLRRSVCSMLVFGRLCSASSTPLLSALLCSPLLSVHFILVNASASREASSCVVCVYEYEWGS